MEVTAPTNNPLTLTDLVLSTWAPPGYPLKIIKFQACLQDPQKSEKVPPRSPKDTKMTPKIIPAIINLLNKWKSEIIQKQQFLQWFYHIQPSDVSIISIPGSLKT
jgi:hypothetical protein